jgi:hypothetical protein
VFGKFSFLFFFVLGQPQTVILIPLPPEKLGLHACTSMLRFNVIFYHLKRSYSINGIFMVEGNIF